MVSHLVSQDTWGATWSLTLGKKDTNVQNAVNHLVLLSAKKKAQTYHSGEKRSHNAIMRVHKRALLDITSKHIPQKSKINANSATDLQSQNQACPKIWYHYCKACESLFSRAGIWKGTCYPTVVRSHRSAHCTQCDWTCSGVDALSYHIKTHSSKNPNQSQNQSFLVT